MRLEDSTGSSQGLQSPSRSGFTNGVAGKAAGKQALSNGIEGRAAGKLENGRTAGGRAPRELNSDYFGHDREEVTRLLQQALQDLGYTDAATTLQEESGYALETAPVHAFRQAVMNGEWRLAEDVLRDMELNPEANYKDILFNIRQQKFLELLEGRDVTRALRVLRMELTPLNHNIDRLHFLSSLMMCLSAEDLRHQANWDGAEGHSRQKLLLKISNYISPSIMVPEHRLATLLHQHKDNELENCKWHNGHYRQSFFIDHHCDRSQFPYYQAAVLKTHADEVYTVQFSHDGQKLASAGNDKNIIIWDVETWEPIHILTGHTNQITAVFWSPDDARLTSCDNIAPPASENNKGYTVKLWDIENQTGTCITTLKDFDEPVSSAAWSPNGKTFITSGLECYITEWSRDGEYLRRHRTERLYGLQITPDARRMVAVSSDKYFIYDYNNWDNFKEYPARSGHITAVRVSMDSKHALINTSRTEKQIAALVDLDTGEVVQSYEGPMPTNFILKGCFGGFDEHFVVSGSEEHKIYIWKRKSGRLVETLGGHRGPINAVSWNPVSQPMFASASDDKTIRIWTCPPRHHRDNYKGKSRSTPMTNGVGRY